MKKVLSLVLAIVMMASVLVVSTSAAGFYTTNIAVGTSTAAEMAAANGALVAGACTLYTDGNYYGTITDVHNIATAGRKQFLLGTNGNAITFDISVASMFPTFSTIITADQLAADYLNVSLVSGYSYMSMSYTVVNLGTALVPNYAVRLTLVPVTGYVDHTLRPNQIVGLGATVNFTHYKWVKNATTQSIGNYVAQPSYNVTFEYDCSDIAQIYTLTNAGTAHQMLMTYDGNVIDANIITAAKTYKVPLMWTDARILNDKVPGAGLDVLTQTDYKVAAYFNSVTNLTPVNMGAVVTETVAGVDAPLDTLTVVNFLANTTITENPTISVRLDADFLNAVDESQLKVYFVEQVEGASTVVKGAKSTLVGNATYGADTAGAPIASFSLLNNKLGTYVITDRELSSPVAEEAAPEVPNVNTGADNTVNVAIVLAVLALAAAGFVAVKKVK